jgi:catechol 2,3-dioxygenase-like lactoylglutathione lyase family enzyme
MSERTITGIHHVTAIASDPQSNLDFYTRVLGLRLVKLTVNFDDPDTYHFYFGDAHGSPGSILTFFPWPGIPRGVVGTGQVSATSFAVPAASLDYWRQRLNDSLVKAEDAGVRFGEPVLRFTDPDGMPLEIIGTDITADAAAWTGGGVERAHAIRAFHSATLAEEGYEKTAALLQAHMGLQLIGSEGNRFRYRVGAGRSAGLVDVVCAPEMQSGRLGAGIVHHIAWRTPTPAQQLEWRKLLVAEGYNVSPVMDRTYFRSIYYREPGSILFEIATDPPGFAVDEAPEHLGERLMLPPSVEPHRARVERALPRLTLPHEEAAARP